jgi:hypothetical protein
MRTTISLAHKRDLLAKMALGEIPTEVIDLPSGKKIRKYQHLSAIKYDAKLSGEEAAKKIDVMGTGLKLSFVLPSRDGQEPIAIQPTPQQPALPSSIFDPQDTIDVTPEEPYEPTISYGHGADTGDTPKEFTWDTPKEFTGDTPKEFTGDTPKEPTGESSGIPRTPSSTSSDGAALEQSIEDNIIFSATGISGRRQQDDDEPEDHVE